MNQSESFKELKSKHTRNGELALNVRNGLLTLTTCSFALVATLASRGLTMRILQRFGHGTGATAIAYAPFAIIPGYASFYALKNTSLAHVDKSLVIAQESDDKPESFTDKIRNGHYDSQLNTIALGICFMTSTAIVVPMGMYFQRYIHEPVRKVMNVQRRHALISACQASIVLTSSFLYANSSKEIVESRLKDDESVRKSFVKEFFQKDYTQDSFTAPHSIPLGQKCDFISCLITIADIIAGRTTITDIIAGRTTIADNKEEKHETPVLNSASSTNEQTLQRPENKEEKHASTVLNSASSTNEQTLQKPVVFEFLMGAH